MGCSGRGTFRMWDVWAAGCLGCEMLGMQGVSDVGCSGFGMWDVLFLNFCLNTHVHSKLLPSLVEADKKKYKTKAVQLSV